MRARPSRALFFESGLEYGFEEEVLSVQGDWDPLGEGGNDPIEDNRERVRRLRWLV